MSSRRLLPLLGALAVAIALGFFVKDDSLRVALPEIVLAAAVSIWCFAPEERPLLHEAHELGVAPRALAQAAVTAGLFAAIGLERGILGGVVLGFALAPLKQAVMGLGGVVTLFVPAWLETRARSLGGGWRRDVRAAIVLHIAGTVAFLLERCGECHTVAVLEHHSLQRGLASVLAKLNDLTHDRAPVTCLLSGLLFVGPAMARIHHATPRVVLFAGLASVVALAGVLHLEADPGLSVGYAVFVAPYALALSLGPAFADKLVRKIEKRLPGRHADSH